MRILQVGDSLAVSQGGTASACAHLANHLVAGGADVWLLTVQAENGARQWTLDPRVRTWHCRPRGPRRLGYGSGLTRGLDPRTPPELVHVHGLWRLRYLQAARFAFRAGLPLVVSVHGMLHRAALARHGGVKRLARWMFQDALLRGAHCLHATAPEEAAEIRRLGFAGPIAVVPWGVDVPREAVARGAAPGGRRTLLYLGRLHPSKGLESLLGAWADVSPRFPSWQLVIAGTGEDRYRAELAALAASLRIGDAVTLRGPVDGADRERLFGAASLVVLPSPAENFGLVVPEALARGVPVLTMQGSPWSRVVAEGCGWWVAPGAGPLSAALACALATPVDTLEAMGERGRLFARAEFEWGRRAADMAALYEWALGRRAEPAFVTR
jgi:glycosyltransferase involved in cell wall biosynthesis